MNAHPHPSPNEALTGTVVRIEKKKKAAIYGTVSLHVYYINIEELMLARPGWEFPIELNQIRI